MDHVIRCPDPRKTVRDHEGATTSHGSWPERFPALSGASTLLHIDVARFHADGRNEHPPPSDGVTMLWQIRAGLLQDTTATCFPVV